MKVRDLKKILENIDDESEVMIWNGIVQDATYMYDEIIQATQYKISPDFYIADLKEEYLNDDMSKNEFKEAMQKIHEDAIQLSNNSEYQFRNKFFTDEMVERCYINPRNVVILQPTMMNKQYQDRLGSIEY